MPTLHLVLRMATNQTRQAAAVPSSPAQSTLKGSSFCPSGTDLNRFSDGGRQQGGHAVQAGQLGQAGGHAVDGEALAFQQAAAAAFEQHGQG